MHVDENNKLDGQGSWMGERVALEILFWIMTKDVLYFWFSPASSRRGVKMEDTEHQNLVL